MLAERWDERELRELGILHAHEPPLEERIDFWMAQLLAANINPWRKKGSPPIDPKELSPNWWGEGKASPKSNMEWKETLKGLTLSLGGKVN